jgi:hypothetical protein
MGRPPGNGSAWFGSLPPRLVGIAGSDFNQVGQDEGVSGKSQGAFSSWFQKMLKEAGADTDRNGWVTLREAVQATASRGIKSTQAEGMGSFGWH